MRPIGNYIEEVKKKAGFKTDKELAIRLGVNPTAIFLIKNGTNTPSEENCKKLAELAKDPYEKVLLLAQVSKASETSKKAWEHILKTAIEAGICTVLLLCFSMASPTLSHASTDAETILHKQANNIHYATWKGQSDAEKKVSCPVK
jgi:transcriptional regulator with XRE-family HTH domain